MSTGLEGTISVSHNLENVVNEPNKSSMEIKFDIVSEEIKSSIHFISYSNNYLDHMH